MIRRSQPAVGKPRSPGSAETRVALPTLQLQRIGRIQRDDHDKLSSHSVTGIQSVSEPSAE